jgi:hypothetical protein
VGKISESEAKEVAIVGEYITLGQFLKFARIIAEGGMAKSYLASKGPGEPRGRKPSGPETPSWRCRRSRRRHL